MLTMSNAGEERHASSGRAGRYRSGSALLLSSCINFGPPLTGSVGTGPTVDTGAIAAGDVNGDGRPEALVMKSDGQLWWVQRCTFDQCLFPTGSVTPPAGVADLATGDFDKNGVDDVVAAGTGGVQVFFGHDLQDPPGEVLTQSGSPILTGAGRTRVVAADLDHDGALDVGVIGGSRYEYYPGDGLGGFRPAVLCTRSRARSSVRSTSSLPATSTRTDGRRRSLRHGRQPDTGAVLYAFAGFESTTLKLQYLTGVPLVGSIDLCDLDGDGGLDLAQVRGGAIWLRARSLIPSSASPSPGSGQAEARPRSRRRPRSTPCAIRDFDANGACDIVAGREGGLSWWHGNGDGTFVTVNGISRIDRNIPGRQEHRGEPRRR